jgi:aspartate carbamoyltransferase catalytic subunit
VSPEETNHVLDLANGCVESDGQAEKKRSLRHGRTIIDGFFASWMRARTSFDIALKPAKGEEAASG